MMPLQTRSAALLVALGATAALGAALYFQYALGYAPCHLCLLQRWAYYIGIPLALVAAVTNCRKLLLLIALIFAANAAFGLYHAGIEWKFWAGPASCGEGAATLGGGNLIQDLQTQRIVPCDQASWRFLGFSFAGWSMVICAGLAAISLIGARKKA
ncbi:disulfide bond formation protein B [Terrihabitans soli]|uniref:Disulfide bond formation protein B n=1 Tax=Terrihabitans soli TaxID=708113 RepID=A0A6S6QN82_9HYPH|nr:disulfide bond formation protein B [Terrihabitans soli]BCJ89377.1 disulfide bond formation protein B [Terrihabitans soli]